MGNSIDNAPSHVNPLLNPSRLEATLIEAFGHAMPTCAHIEYRLVGTGAALLYGVPLPAGDIDLLVKERQSVDAFSSALSFFKCLTPPAYLADARQYFAEYEINNIAIGISTVEWQTESDGIECFGRGPWAHFILLPCGAYTVPTVALELRLVSELYRQRPERYLPLIQFMHAHGCDTELVHRGMMARSLPETLQRDVLHQLRRT